MKEQHDNYNYQTSLFLVYF